MQQSQLLLQKAVLSLCKVGNSSIPAETPSLLSLLPVLSPQVWGCGISQLAACRGKPASAHCLCGCSDRAALAGKTHLAAQQRHGGAQRWARSKAAWAFHTHSSPRLHILLAHINHPLLIVTSFLWKAQKGLRSFPILIIWLEDEAFCLLWKYYKTVCCC